MHTFHIPIMGTGFTIDTPVKVAQYGISSVISLVDDTLIEEMRQYYCEQEGLEYVPIKKGEDDYRARRITSYLNLLDSIVKRKFAEVRDSSFEPGSEITKYFELLPDASNMKLLYNQMKHTDSQEEKKAIQEKLRTAMKPGSIDVNIMTKLDRINYGKDRKELPMEYADAHAALRGYAESNLDSSIIFSAGFNRRLYSYCEKFKDFYANASGYIKKKIVLKVSDYRSSIVQGQFFAKKGLWVSEYRIESGLNCGGHAFATNGTLMGPILEEFKQKKQQLITSLKKAYNKALEAKGHDTFDKAHETKITAQGGIGTARENDFLFSHYKVDGTGWGTPFLLVPEAVNVDDETLNKLSKARAKDLYMSEVSPLGILFNNLVGSVSDTEKRRLAAEGQPGAPCTKGHLVSNTEFTEKPVCLASRQFQKMKLSQLEELDLDEDSRRERIATITDKACICHDLGAAPLINHQINMKNRKLFTAVCPGPNLAYFSKIATLREMVSHIYGRINLLNNTYRPHMFIQELRMYVDHLKKEVRKCALEPTEKKINALNEFKENLLSSIEYYRNLFPNMVKESQKYREMALAELQSFKETLEALRFEHAPIGS